MGLSGRFAVLRVDKTPGPTSHDVVAMARRALGTRRVGHTGTLDPFASGLLLLCVGAATRLSEYLAGLAKCYVATACLGQRTDTDDAAGRVLRVSGAWRTLDARGVEEVLATFVGCRLQVPPAYSAKKVEGRPLYERARRGVAVKAEPVPVEIHAITVLEVALPEVTFHVDCSSGTYVRALARDLGEALGVGAHLTRLRRLRVGRFSVEDAVPAGELHDAERVARAWLTPAQALAHLPRADVGTDEAVRLAHGQGVRAPPSLPEGAEPVAVFRDDELVAVAAVRGGWLRPNKVFARD
ncbi:MAG: tRNA pseudouridine(55) synthase TruB [Gemmatimonadetes bacterium]|nr:tRNA pseudouridine(55) synthase TruB [Gemmatimonadota bacterium]